jgi:hypothetical protein
MTENGKNFISINRKIARLSTERATIIESIKNSKDWYKYPANNNVNYKFNKIYNLGEPTNNSQAATKMYVDNNVTIDASEWYKFKAKSNIDLGTFNIINLKEPINNSHATTKNYVDSNITTDASEWHKFIAKTNVDLGTFNIINLGEPTNNSHGATKNYVDSNITTDASEWYKFKAKLDIDLDLNNIKNLAEPFNDTDAATKNYVDSNTISDASGWHNFISKSNVDLGTYIITNLGEPTNNSHAATKNYVDSNITTDASEWHKFIAKTNVDLGSYNIINLGEPTNNSHAATKNYVDSNTISDASGWHNFISKSNVDLGTYNIINLGEPTNNSHAATKNYVDSNTISDASGWHNFTANSDVDLGLFNIINLEEPTNNSHAATKSYVDNNTIADASGWHNYSANSNIDAGNNKLINLSKPNNNNDGVNLSFYRNNNEILTKIGNTIYLNEDIEWHSGFNWGSVISNQINNDNTIELLPNQTFNGQGHSIFIKNGETYEGMFSINQNVSNFKESPKVRGIYVHWDELTQVTTGGGIIQSGSQFFIVDNCQTDGSIGGDGTFIDGGGIVGKGSVEGGECLINNCKILGDTYNDAGSIIGLSLRESPGGIVRILNCSIHGDMIETSNSNDRRGGMFAFESVKSLSSNATIFIENCYFVGSLLGSNGESGAFIPAAAFRNNVDKDGNIIAQVNCHIKNCFATSGIMESTDSRRGIFMGRDTGDDGASITIQNCYSTIEGEFISESAIATIEDCIAYGSISGTRVIEITSESDENLILLKALSRQFFENNKRI